jgi:hypothetical protein
MTTQLEGGPISFMPDQRTALWHHLCARRAEIAGTRFSLNNIVDGWGDERLGEPLRELDELIELVGPPPRSRP